MAARVESLELHRKAAARQASATTRSEEEPEPRRERKRMAAKAQPDSLEQIMDFVRQLADAVNPDVMAGLQKEVEEKMRRVPMRLNRYGYDPWGLQRETTQQALAVAALFYRYYFRARASGFQNLPRGRVLVIANHAGQIPIDEAMIATAVFFNANPPRILRAMGEYWLPTVPFMSELMPRTGSVVGTPKNCVDLLHNNEAVIAFPEGIRGMNKVFTQRYRLQEFGLGFIRLALETKTPIVPAAVVGSEEQAPAILNVTWLARLLGMPAFPITPTWPWLGLLGVIPYPSRYHIYFGKPIRFEGDPNDEDRVVRRHADKVKRTIQAMLNRGLRERKAIFF
jgi:1-acyl-sn-glycerol-3-phosphate acyltransferase